MKRLLSISLALICVSVGLAWAMSAEEYFDRGAETARQGNYAKAIDDYTRAIEIRPDFEKAYSSRGKAYRHLGEFDKAFSDYAKAMELNPFFTPVYNNAAWLYATCPDKTYRDGEKAVLYASKAVQLMGTPGQMDTLAAAYVENRQPENAFDTYLQVMKKDARFIRTYQKSLKKQGYYSGNTDGLYTQQLEEALMTCIKDGNYL